jgi:hypothetical protein
MDIIELKKLIQDTLSPLKFPNGERLIRLMHVSGDAPMLTLNYFTNNAVIERNPGVSLENMMSSALDSIQELTDSGLDVALNYENALRYGWGHPWLETAYDKFPTVVAVEAPEGGQIHALVCYDPHLNNSTVAIASEYVELEQIPFGKGQPVPLTPGESWHGLVFDHELSAASLDDILNAAPRSSAGQCGILIYRNHEWHSGISNLGGDPNMGPVADHSPVPVSKAKRETRPTLPLEQFTDASVKGTIAELEPVFSAFDASKQPKYMHAESHPAVQALCQQWNAAHPGQTAAGAFRVYMWDESIGVFVAGDPEEPNWKPEFFTDYMKSVATYYDPEKQLLAVVIFTTPRATWSETDRNCVKVRTVCGEELFEVGTSADEYDEAYYAWSGIRSLYTRTILNQEQGAPILH